MIQSSELYDSAARDTLRTLLTSDAKGTLYLFAQRRVVLGQRTSNVSYCHQALAALSLLPTMNDVPWTTWFLAALVLGGYAKDADVVTLFEGPSTPGGVRCQVLQNSLEHGGSLAQCHLALVSTTYGTGIIELPLPHDVPARGFSGAPVIDRTSSLYAPTMNLAQLAVDVADGLDQLEGTRTTGLTFSFLSIGASASVPNLGCLHCTAVRSEATFDVYVTEFESASSATQLTAELYEDEGVAVCSGAKVVLLKPQPNFDDDQLTSRPDTAALETLARDALLNY
jgi:hypothetical protein